MDVDTLPFAILGSDLCHLIGLFMGCGRFHGYRPHPCFEQINQLERAHSLIFGQQFIDCEWYGDKSRLQTVGCGWLTNACPYGYGGSFAGSCQPDCVRCRFRVELLHQGLYRQSIYRFTDYNPTRMINRKHTKECMPNKRVCVH